MAPRRTLPRWPVSAVRPPRPGSRRPCWWPSRRGRRQVHAEPGRADDRERGVLALLHGTACGQGFVAAYERFGIINRDLKQLITRWQTLELGGKTVANDHSDSAYDERIIGQLGDLHERFEAVLAALVKGEPRLGVYQDKLGRALERAEDGAVEWVSDARIDSYHTVWFELHEDLLRLLGRTRDE